MSPKCGKPELFAMLLSTAGNMFVYYGPSASIAKLTFKHQVFVLFNQQLTPCLVETDNSKEVQGE